MNTEPMRRREALLALGGLGVGAAFGVRSLLKADTALAAPDCLLQREVTEGPYYLDLDLVRRNIKGDRRGTPLALRFTVVDAPSNSADGIYRAAGERALCSLTRKGSGYAGAMTVGIAI